MCHLRSAGQQVRKRAGPVVTTREAFSDKVKKKNSGVATPVFSAADTRQKSRRTLLPEPPERRGLHRLLYEPTRVRHLRVASKAKKCLYRDPYGKARRLEVMARD